jgi:hypothetical protein
LLRFAPDGNTSPTANTDLINLVTLCHARSIRFFVDVVMAFSTHGSVENTNFPDFHIFATTTVPTLSPHAAASIPNTSGCPGSGLSSCSCRFASMGGLLKFTNDQFRCGIGVVRTP